MGQPGVTRRAKDRRPSARMRDGRGILLDMGQSVDQKRLLMNSGSLSHPSLGVRFVAGFMMLGALSGIVGSVTPGISLVRHGDFLSLLLIAIPFAVYAGSAWVGWELWRGRNRSLPWARLLFGLQSVFFDVGGVAYDFWMGMAARVSVAGWMTPMPPPSHSLTVGGNFGASFHFDLTRQDSQWTAGLNLVALLVFVYLLMLPRNGKGEAVAVGNGATADATAP